MSTTIPPSAEGAPDDGGTKAAVAHLLERMEFDHQRGTLSIFGARFIFARASLIAHFVREAERDLGRRAWELLERAAEATGLEASEAWRRWGTLPFPEAIGALRPIWPVLGLGTIAIEASEAEGRARLTTPNSPWPEAFGPSDHPVCRVFVGYCLGIARGMGYRGLRCREQACRAMGADACEFDLWFEPRGERRAR